MALSRALLKRLNSEDDPLPKRLKLAETAFSTVDLPLIQKEDLLLEWLCKICNTNQCGWKTLNNCLKSNNIDIKANVKQCLNDTLVHILDDVNVEAVQAEILECCCLTLANSSMRQYYTRKPKDLGLLIKALLNNILKRSSFNNLMQKKYDQLPKICELSSVENCAMISIVESLMQIYKQSLTTKEELRLTFIHDILYPLCNIIDHSCTDNTNKLGIVAYKCIQQLLLGKTKQATESNRTKFSDLYSVLSKNAETLNLESNLLTYLFIFRTAVGTYKSDAILLDDFFRNLVNSSGRYKYEILNFTLKLLNDVTLDFENAIEGVTLFEYLQELISEILMCDVTRTHYRILAQLAYINPFLIEKNISNILDKILMKKQVADYANLLIALLHASTKLRREQKFISQLLTTLKQHVTADRTHEISAFTFYPWEFKAKLAKSIGNMSNSQTIAGLRTLLYYLNTDCVELLESNTSGKNILMLKATVEMLVTFLESMQIFECTRALSAHEKFINVLEELGNAVSLLINKALCLSHDKNIIVILLTAVQSLSEMQNALNYYIPKVALAKTLTFPIQDDHWQQLIQRISNFGEDNCKNIMNQLILHRRKLNISYGKTPSKLHGLIGGLDYSWNTILRHDALSLLNTKEMSKLAYLLLTTMTSSEQNFREWLDIFDKEYFQENKCFVLCLLNHILVQIGKYLIIGCTKSITKHIDCKLLVENEHNKNDKLTDTLQVIKELILQQQWVQMTDAAFSNIGLYLEILFHLPLTYFDPDVRTLTLLVVYSISKECKNSEKISTVCSMIFSELLEKTGIDLFEYIGPTLLMNELPHNKAFLRACEFSLRNVSIYATLKNLVNVSTQSKEAMYVLLECIETVKPKLGVQQKIIFKKAEKKLAKAILNTLPEEINDAFDVKCLIIILKMTIPTGKITSFLKKLTESTLRNIFKEKDDSTNPIEKTLLQQGVQLAVIVVQHCKTFEIQEETVRNLWFVMLKHPCKTLLKPLLASTGLKEFHELLKLLHDRTVDGLSRADEAMWNSAFVIWSDVIKTDMRIKRNKMRFVAINNLFKVILLENTRHLYIPDEYWSNLLRLSNDIISAKHLLIPDVTVDIIMMIGLRSLEKTKLSSCENVLALCGSLIKIRTNLITDRLPNLLLLYRIVVKTIVYASKNVIDKFDEHRFRCFALDIEKLTGLLVKLKKDMIRLSPYLVADLLRLIPEGNVPSYIKMALKNSLCHLIGICDQHGIALLSRALPTSLQEVFKVQMDMFKKFYKYSGKI